VGQNGDEKSIDAETGEQIKVKNIGIGTLYRQ
jgi:hypothetical protein